MRIRNTVLALGLLALSGTGFASASPINSTSQVEFHISTTATQAQIVQSIRQQAKDICSADVISGSVAHRLRATRKCEKRLVNQVVTGLANEQLTACLNTGVCDEQGITRLAGTPSQTPRS